MRCGGRGRCLPAWGPFVSRRFNAPEAPAGAKSGCQPETSSLPKEVLPDHRRREDATPGALLGSEMVGDGDVRVRAVVIAGAGVEQCLGQPWYLVEQAMVSLD